MRGTAADLPRFPAPRFTVRNDSVRVLVAEEGNAPAARVVTGLDIDITHGCDGEAFLHLGLNGFRAVKASQAEEVRVGHQQGTEVLVYHTAVQGFLEGCGHALLLVWC